MATYLIDTSILLNILDVPGKSQDRDAVIEALRDITASRHSLILPMTTVIETGNHIAQLKNGHDRRDRAAKLARILADIIADKAPWTLSAYEWDRELLKAFIDDPLPSGGDFVATTTDGLGAGDRLILLEKQRLRKRGVRGEITVWTLDAKLKALSDAIE